MKDFKGKKNINNKDDLIRKMLRKQLHNIIFQKQVF